MAFMGLPLVGAGMAMSKGAQTPEPKRPKRDWGRAAEAIAATLNEINPSKGTGHFAAMNNRWSEQDAAAADLQQRAEAQKRMQAILAQIEDPEMRSLAQIAPEQYVTGEMKRRAEAVKPQKGSASQVKYQELTGMGVPDAEARAIAYGEPKGAGAGGGEAFSTFQGADGQMYIVDRSGQARSTGVSYRPPSSSVKFGDVPMVYVPGQGFVPVEDPATAGRRDEAFKAESDVYDRRVEGEKLDNEAERLRLAGNADERAAAEEGRKAEDRTREESARVRRDTESIRSARQRFNEIKVRGQELMNLSSDGLGGSTGVNSVAAVIPGTRAKNFANQKKVLDAAAAFDQLKAMRDASENGSSGLGQVTNVEIDLLSNSLAALQQSSSAEVFDREMQRFIDVYGRTVDRLEASYRDKYGDLPEVETAQESFRQEDRETAKSDLPRIRSDAEYQALPSGAVFVGPDGQKRRKP